MNSILVADGAGFMDHPNHKFVKGDVCDGGGE